MKTEAYLIWRRSLSYSKHAETMRKIWANHQRISKILTIHFQTHAWVVRIPIIVLNVSSAKVLSYFGMHYDFEDYIPTWIVLRAMNWMWRAFERFGVVRWCWPYNISNVLYIAVMWVFLTFVSKLLVLNHMRNDVEQPNLHVCREMAN